MEKQYGKTWTLWLKWDYPAGWYPAMSISVYGRGAISAKEVLEEWAANNFPSKWGGNWRKESVRILPEGKVPAGYTD